MERVSSLELFMILLEMHWVSIHLICVGFGLLKIVLIMYLSDSCIPNLYKTFIMKQCKLLSEAFSVSNVMNMCFCFFQFVCMVDYSDWLSCVKLSLQVYLGWSLLDLGEWSWWVLGFSLPVFYWVFLLLCSWV